MTERPAGATLRVDLDALARNYARLRAAAGRAECAAVVKADAYGLGLAPVARRLEREGCKRFFVATLAEAEALRDALPAAAIYVLEGAVEGAADALRAARAVPVLASLEQIARWRGPALLQIDTGMARLGLDAADVERLAARPELLAGIEIEYVLTHFACADEPEHALNCAQLARFERLRRLLPAAPTSIGNSAAVFRDSAHRGDLVRPGIALYGGNPFVARPNPLETVATLTAPILQLRSVVPGEPIGYGATYAAVRAARIAIVGAGYADGYPRAVGNRGAAFVAGRRVPVVGRVSMDLACLDVSDVPPDALARAREAELIGPNVTVDEVAAWAGTISYEILTGLGKRPRREYVGAGA